MNTGDKNNDSLRKIFEAINTLERKKRGKKERKKRGEKNSFICVSGIQMSLERD